MVIRILILTLFASAHLNSYACQCIGIEDLKEAQLEEFENSDLVFAAEVVKVYKSDEYKEKGWFNNVVYELRVTEGFKGTEDGILIKGHALTSCDIYPKENETWLIYANKGKKGMISISECGISRSIFEPQRILYRGYTSEPPPRNHKEKPDFMFDIGIQLAQLKLKATKDLKEEILWLRAKN